MKFYEKYPARIDQLLDIVVSNPELKEQLISNLQQNSELRAIFQDHITLSPIIAVLLQTNREELILENKTNLKFRGNCILYNSIIQLKLHFYEEKNKKGTFIQSSNNCVKYYTN